MPRRGPEVGTRIRVAAGPWSAAGEALCPTDGVEVRVRGLIPGETADVHIVHRSRGGPVAWANVAEVVDADPGRRAPPCPIEGTCGGCGLQHVSEGARLRHLVASRTLELPSALRAVLAPETEWIRSPGFGWRHKAVFLPAWSRGLLLGGFARGSHDVVDQPDCGVLAPALRDARAELKAAFEPLVQGGLMLRPPGSPSGPGLRAFVARANRRGEVLVTAVVRDPGSAERVGEALAQLVGEGALTGAHLQVCDAPSDAVHGREAPTVVAGASRLVEEIGGVGLPLLPLAFFQVNPGVLDGLVRRLRGEARGASALLDGYCGVGALGLGVAAGLEPTPRVWGFDTVPAGVEEARRLAAGLGIEADYRVGRADVVDGLVPEVAIVDPPRRGCGAGPLAQLVEGRPQTLLYVSCHAASLGRDADALTELGYAPAGLWPADMLPQTGHLELIARFERQ